MVELYPGFFAMLRLAKRLHDSDLMHKIPDEFQTLALDEDFYYELAYTAIDAVFETTIRDCNEERGMDIYVFCDPLIDRFCQLCRQYELICRMTEEENPYRKDIERIIRTGFCLSGYAMILTGNCLRLTGAAPGYCSSLEKSFAVWKNCRRAFWRFARGSRR